MPIVYRSVRVVLQNCTDDMLTVEGGEVLTGVWTASLGIKKGDVVAGQSARAFATESSILERGSEAYVRFGSIAGYVEISWYLPWVGDFRISADAEGRRKITVRINDDEPAAIAVLVILEERDKW